MRYSTFCVALSLFILFSLFGCSKSKNTNPVIPSGDDTPVTNQSSDNRAIIASGTFEFDLEKMEVRNIPDRDVNYHHYLNGYLVGYVYVEFLEVNPPFVTIEITIENPSDWQVYDVRAIYYGLHGKEVLNPDGYTNFFDQPGGMDFNPFHYFAKEYDNQAFPVGPGATDSEIMELLWPDGEKPVINYVIEGCLEENAYEPVKIHEVSIDGSVTPIGGGIVAYCNVEDWQNDISSVVMYCEDLLDEEIPMYRIEDSNTYFGNYINFETVEHGTPHPPGEYTFWIRAESDNPDDIMLWMPFQISIPDTAFYAPQFDDYPYADPVRIAYPQSSTFESTAFDNEGDELDYLWDVITPFYPEGEFSAEGNEVANPVWIAAITSLETEYFFKVSVSERHGIYTSCAILSLIVDPTSPPEIVLDPMFVPNPILENLTGNFSVHAIDPDDPYDPFPPLSYFWFTVPPTQPGGEWENGAEYQHEKCPNWIAPEIDGESLHTFRVRVTKGDCNPPLFTEADVEVIVYDTSPPQIVEGPIFVPNPINETKIGSFSIHAIDPDDPFDEFPPFTYFWTTVPPSGPNGEWENGWDSQISKCPRWIAPPVDEETLYTFHVMITKHDHDPPLYTHAELEVIVEDVD